MNGAVYLHVGLKKTGTSYLQSILRASRKELQGQGLALLPKHEPAGHRLARAVLGLPVAGDPIAALPRQLGAAAGGRCLISQELLGRANSRQIARLVPTLDRYEVHVVVTARDVARTIPSAWQQYVKAGHSYPFEEFLDAVLCGRESRAATSFWLDHGLVELLQRWGRLTTPSSTHVVVLPRPGSAPDVLLERFCRVLHVDPSRLERGVARPNEGLGLAQVELLRRMNETPGSYPPKVYGKVYKREFAGGVLAAQDGGRRPVLPASSKEWCRDYTKRTVEALTAQGYDVVGDIEDLDPPESAFTEHLQQVSDAELGAVAVSALRTLLDARASEVERARASSRGRRTRQRR